jgi:AraC-like DNA-binding protein
MSDVFRLKSVGLSGNAGRVRCEPGWSLDASWSRELVDYDLWLVWAGRGRMRLSEGVIDLVPGTCIWMRPGRNYVAEQDLENRLGVSFCHFVTGRYKGRYKGQVDLIPPFEVTQVRSLDLVQQLMAEIIRRRVKRPELAARVLTTLLAVLIEDHGEAALVKNGRHHGLMRSLAAQIAEEPGRSWRIGEMAKVAGYAADHFSRVFRDVIGRRPQSYILNTRIARAQQLLKETHLSIGEIAQVLGFRDVFYFSRQFRAVAGLPPSAFRRGKGIIPVPDSASSA